MYQSNSRLKDLVTTTKPTSIEPGSRTSYQTNPLVRALKTTASNQSIPSFWSNLIPKLYNSKIPQFDKPSTGRSQTPSKLAKSKNPKSKLFSSSQKRKAKIVFNSRKLGGKVLKLKGVKRDRSKNLSCKKNEKAWIQKSRMKKGNTGEYCYLQKKSKSKSRAKPGPKKVQFSKSPGSIRQTNFSNLSKNKTTRNMVKGSDTRKSGQRGSSKTWKIKQEYPGLTKGTSGSQMKDSSKFQIVTDSGTKKSSKRPKKTYSKTPKHQNYGLDALKITFEYLSSSKNVDKQLRTGTFMSNTSAGRLFSPKREPGSPLHADMQTKANLLFKPNPVPIKLSKNKLTHKNLKINKLQINVDSKARGGKRKVKPASTRIATNTNFFPSKKLMKKKFCEYNGETMQALKKEQSVLRLKKAETPQGRKMYLSKNENVWTDPTRKDWKGFTTCKNYIGSSRNFYGGSNLFGGRFHKEEKLVNEIVGNRPKGNEEPEYGLKKSKTHKKGRKLSESLKKGALKSSKKKILKLSKSYINGSMG